MACIAVSFEAGLKQRLERFPWVNWSEAGREEALKREIFERYVKTRKLNEEDNKFCEQIDWHPVDELPLREEFVKELKKARCEKAGKPMTLEEFNKWCEGL
jgi:hypothetical protein